MELGNRTNIRRNRPFHVLCIGAGPWEWEYLGHPTDPKTRGDMLDEGLDVLVGLWSGQPFDYHGAYHSVRGDLPENKAQFLPASLQQPRIPIWVAGVWPNRRPFHRAARWDGVVPLWDEHKTPEDLRLVVATIQQHRPNLDAFDVVVAGATSETRSAADTARLQAYVDAGATWWVETVDPWRFGWNGHGEWPIAAMNRRICSGPPQ